MVGNWSRDGAKKNRAIELRKKFPDLRDVDIAERLGRSISWVRDIFHPGENKNARNASLGKRPFNKIDS